MLCLTYAIQQSFGKTQIMLYALIPSILIYIPTMLLVAKKYGTVGAAVTFSVISVIQDFVIIYFTHKRFVAGEHFSWCWNDLCRPLIASMVTGIIIKFLISWPLTGIVGFATIIVSYLVVLLVTIQATPATYVFIKKLVT